MADHIPVGLMLDCGRAVAKMQCAPKDTPREWLAFQDLRVRSARGRVDDTVLKKSEDQPLTQMSISPRRIYSEIYNTELVYEAQLEVIDKVVLRPALALGLRCSSVVQAFVDGIAQLVRLHADVVRTMKLEGDESAGGLLMSFHKALPFMKIYKMVIAGHAETEHCLEELASRSLHYAALLREADVSLSTLLIRPLQRVYGYHLLFGKLLKHTDPASSTVPLIEAVCKRAHEIAEYLDGQHESTNRQRTLYHALAQHFGLEAGCTAPFHVIKEETANVCVVSTKKAAMLSRTVTLLSMAVTVSVVTKGQYLLEEIAPISSVIVEVCAEDAQIHGVRLHWLERERPVEMLIAYKSAAERTDWLQAFRLLSAEINACQPDLSALRRKLGDQLVSPRSRNNPPSLLRFARRASVGLAHRLGTRGASSPSPSPLSPRRILIYPTDSSSSAAFSTAREHRSSLSTLSADELPTRFGRPKHRARSQSLVKVQTVHLIRSAPTCPTIERSDAAEVVDDDFSCVAFSRSASVDADDDTPTDAGGSTQLRLAHEDEAGVRARHAAHKLRRSRALSNLETRSLRTICQSGRT
eukprot:CAMPEP_0177682678 /NCGR_PEP_ID=MMETSP0447-20121125/31383_1 /TAXON_ID=0 /ORGANISM="Stygamoeba regulata, Strain BSH-02190019" /LENGTH=581 /DNA_ID=CAMNT_0019192189 /DNA_START=406 /DNA_END=2151 /DNA_ORIENTATION=-